MIRLSLSFDAIWALVVFRLRFALTALCCIWSRICECGWQGIHYAATVVEHLPESVVRETLGHGGSQGIGRLETILDPTYEFERRVG